MATLVPSSDLKVCLDQRDEEKMCLSMALKQHEPLRSSSVWLVPAAVPACHERSEYFSKIIVIFLVSLAAGVAAALI